MTSDSPLSVVVSQEELAVILRYLDADSLLGLELEVFEALSTDQVTLVLGVAERALIARGFLKLGPDNRFQLAPAILAVVGACAFPETSLIVTRNRPGNPGEVIFFHTSRQMIVMHTIPITAIHQFIAVEEMAAVAQATLSILDLDLSLGRLTSRPVQMEQAVLMEARDSAEGGNAAAAFRVLSQAKVDEGAARELAETLAHPVANTTLAYIEHDATGVSTDGFTLLQGEGALWLLTPVEGSATELVSISPVSAEEAVQRVKALLRL